MIKTRAGDPVGTPRPQKIYRMAQLPAMTGYCTARIWQLIGEGKFPRGIKLAGGNATGWLESDILAWQQSLVDQRDAEAEK